jgi:uncharacterized protein
MTYHILSLDGGGTWSLIQVKALMALYGENASGQAVLEDFDLVAASSGGSIVLGGLVEGLRLGEILALFQNQAQRESIFSPTHCLVDEVVRNTAGVGPKYSTKNKLSALQNAFPRKGSALLSVAAAGVRRPGSKEDVHLLIIGFDYDRSRAAFFRSSPASGPVWGIGQATGATLADAIHASTNAPVNYFDAPATIGAGSGRYWDGAISGCNNPVLAGVTEAIVKGQNPTEIAVLSIGTATVALPWPQVGEGSSPYVQQVVKSDLVADLRKLAGSILDDPPDIATFLAHVMTGSGIGLGKPPADSRIVRMNPLVSPVKNAQAWCAPGSMTTEQFTYLANLDMDAVEQQQVDAISNYADFWLRGAAPNEPIRMNGDTLEPELGQTTFQAAIAAWNAIK